MAASEPLSTLKMRLVQAKKSGNQSRISRIKKDIRERQARDKKTKGRTHSAGKRTQHLSDAVKRRQGLREVQLK